MRFSEELCSGCVCSVLVAAQDRKHLHVEAGPNLLKAFYNVGDGNAAGGRPLGSTGAGKEVLRLAKEHLERRKSFAVETTFSGKNYLQMMQYARGVERAFEVILVYIGTESVEINLARIARRALAGGHHVPEVDVRRSRVRSSTAARFVRLDQ
jgi:hypothetical protein